MLDNIPPVNKVICATCEHYNNDKFLTCKAFTERIPADILTGGNDHKKIVVGQVGDFVYKNKMITIENVKG